MTGQTTALEMAPRARRLALAASVAWALCMAGFAAVYLGTRAPGGPGLMLALSGLAAALALPIAVFWAIAAIYAGMGRRLSADLGATNRVALLEQRLEAAERKLKALERARAAPAGAPAPKPAALAPPTPSDPGSDPGPNGVPTQQPSLPLIGGADGMADITLEDTVRALNFPRDAGDQDGFAVLSRALAWPELSRLLHAAEDCLTLLSHEGLYMDDLMPARASAADWRQFAKGGEARAALLPLTGITDAGALDTVRGQMRQDPIFRDAALHFQRKFDTLLQRLAPDAPDQVLLDLVDTRSGRAYVLLVQVATASEAA